MKLSIIAAISLFFIACKSLPKVSDEENLMQIADSLSYTNIADTLNPINDSLLNNEMPAIKDNRAEDTYNIVKLYEPTEEITITKKTKHFKLQGYDFKVFWNEHFNYVENLNSYYGGIAKLEISKNNKLLQTLDTIADEDAMGEIHLTASDFNFDGKIDFTLPLGACGKGCYFKYYIFNPNENKFTYVKSWDYMRIQSTKSEEKLIRTVVEGTCCSVDYTIYKVDGLNLIELKKIHLKQ